MEKLIFLLGDAESGEAPRGRTDLRDALLGAAPALVAAGARRLDFTVADLDGPEVDAIAQFNQHGLIDATVSIWVDSLDGRDELEKVLAPLAKRCAVYLVTESVPRARDDGALEEAPGGFVRSNGVALVTTFPKPEKLDDETFFARWHGSHTPLSLEIHPLVHYVRNSVARSLTPGAPPLRAIVNEAVASAGVAADPDRFYGSRDDRKRAVRDLLSFVEFEQLSTAVMSEYLYRG